MSDRRATRRTAKPLASIPEEPHSAQSMRAGAPPSLTSRRRRVTLVQCLLNTNESNGGEAAVRELHTFLSARLFTEHGLRRVLLAASTLPREHKTRELIRRVEIRAASIEIGQRQQRVHAHWVMKIVHSDARLNIGVMQRAVQDYTRKHTSFTRPFCSIKLLNGAPENYALKEVYDELDVDEASGGGSSSSSVETYTKE